MYKSFFAQKFSFELRITVDDLIFRIKNDQSNDIFGYFKLSNGTGRHLLNQSDQHVFFNKNLRIKKLRWIVFRLSSPEKKMSLTGPKLSIIITFK